MLTLPLLLAFAGCQNLAVSEMPAAKPVKSFYNFTMTDIDGHKVRLSKFKGKVVLVVNVASFCGNTPQYKALEALYESHKDQGFVILGFPANNFGAQEPGSDPQIKEFCTSKYNVTFPMFSKISVKGQDEHELYQWLISNSDRPKDDIEWNFSKFVIDRKGQVVARFKSKSTPESPEVTGAIEKALSESH